MADYTYTYTVHFSNIVWDTEAIKDEQDDAAERGETFDPRLPTEATLECEFAIDQTESERIDQAIDELSEKYGWLIEGATVNGVMGEEV